MQHATVAPNLPRLPTESRRPMQVDGTKVLADAKAGSAPDSAEAPAPA